MTQATAQTKSSGEQSNRYPRQHWGTKTSCLWIWISLISLIWFVLLPMWSRQDSMAKHMEWLDEQGVDPSALYYTELEAMKPIIAKFNQRNRIRQKTHLSKQTQSKGEPDSRE